MKALGKNRFSRWHLIASALLTVVPAIAFSQGRPGIVWASGGHSDSVNSVAYSPDGARATFYSTGVNSACEVTTSDYKITRCLSLTDLNASFSPLFYNPSDGICENLSSTVAPPPPPPPPAPPAPPAAPPATPAPPAIDLAITKSGSPNPATLGNSVTWTETVTNNGPDAATGVKVADPLPAGMTFVSVTSSQGTCTGGAVVSCNLGSLAKGASVTITIVTTASTKGSISNTATVVGNEAETNTANNTATASVVVQGAFTPKPPVRYCTAVRVGAKTLLVDRKVTLTLRVSYVGELGFELRIRIKGATLAVTTAPSNARGMVKVTVQPKRAGIVTFTPVSSKSCSNPRVGVTGVFTPPVTG